MWMLWSNVMLDIFVCSTVEKKIVLPMSATNFIDP